ncbi:VCBS repeat-containing protein, partial [Escherichia coli]|nr:VCBS repeat-containing protein [Escherichia coli]
FYHLNNGAPVSWVQVATSSPAYSVVGVADFDGNGSTDILFRNNKTGDTGFYKIDHGQFVDWVSVGSSSPDYRVVDVGDFDKNGSVDILFQ